MRVAVTSGAIRRGLLLATTALVVVMPDDFAHAQTGLPEIVVTQPKQRPAKRTQAVPQRRIARRATPAPAPAPAPAPPPPPSPQEQHAAATRAVVQENRTLDQRRDAIRPPTGANVTGLNQEHIDSLPQGSNIQVSDLMLQLPGVTQDSTSQGDFHVRNEHGNVQYRINGILLPDGVSGFSQFIETSFIKNLALITGALPAQYGLHTAGIVDITTKSGADLQGGTVGIYGGSQGTITPWFEYGGVAGKTDYFFTGRYLSTNLGLENPTPNNSAIHDHSEMGRFFSYTSTLLDPWTRVTSITGMSSQRFQIPNNPGQTPVNDPVSGAFPGLTAWGIGTFDSANINQNQYEKNGYAVLAWQRSIDAIDLQVSYYSRYNSVHFVPDPVGDMLFNGTASDVFRSSFLNGVAADGAYRLNDAHTIRAGVYTNGEYTQIASINTVEALDATGAAVEPPFNINDSSNLFGWQLGAYAQDEWRITNALTLNAGLRFDQIYQYVDANQLSPRVNVTYQPWWATAFHAGYARTFTPPAQALGRVFQEQLFDNTTNASATVNTGSILPERANVYDVGVVQQLLPACPAAPAGMATKAPVAKTNCPTLEVGLDAYYKDATDLLDDGQFGQAYVLTAFNYERAINKGLEAKVKFTWGNFAFYTAWAWAVQKANTVASNQSLFGPDELTFIAQNWVYTDHAQLLTGSANASYRFDGGMLDGAKISASMIYGSGLRAGFANTDHVPAYAQFNAGISKEFKGWGWNGQPLTVRFDVVNMFDTIYVIRDGSGIGVFAPQFGPRRGYFVGLSQKIGPAENVEGPFASYFTKAPALPKPVYGWEGFYAGAHFGDAFDLERGAVEQGLLAVPALYSTNPTGALGGLQAGYNVVLAPNLLVGIEPEFTWNSAQGTANFFDNITAATLTSNHDWYATLTGRIGYLQGPLLAYVKAGGAWMNADYQLNASSGAGGVNGSALNNTYRSGWTVGGGLEYMLTPRWSAKAEYSFLDFGTTTLGIGSLVPGVNMTVNTQVHEVKAGVNFHLPPGLAFAGL